MLTGDNQLFENRSTAQSSTKVIQSSSQFHVWQITCYSCAQKPVWNLHEPRILSAADFLWIVQSYIVATCLFFLYMIYFMVISLYDEHASCLRHFSMQLHFWNSRKQWKAVHPSRTATPLVRQEKRTRSKQQRQETGAKKQIRRQVRRTQNTKAFCYRKPWWLWTGTLDTGRPGADQVKWKSFKGRVI